MCSLGMLIGTVVGILAGTWLSEYGGRTRYGHVVRFFNDVLLSAPSIVIGLFVYELLVRPFQGILRLAGAVALAILVVPVVTRTTEDILSLQPTAARGRHGAWARRAHSSSARSSGDRRWPAW